jgi:hypothetical protein
MGKLCRIRLLRPEGLKAKEEGVSDNELAVLTGSSEALMYPPPKKKRASRQKKKPRKN